MERDSRGYNNNQRRNDRYDRNKQEEIVKINEPLHKYYADKSKLFLEGAEAYKQAEKFGRIPSHQLRKILNQSKLCVQELENKEDNFENVRNKLLSLLPLSAYNAGRDPKLKELYKFLVSHLNLNSLKSSEDIKTFDELFTSIVAYHKYLGGK